MILFFIFTIHYLAILRRTKLGVASMEVFKQRRSSFLGGCSQFCHLSFSLLFLFSFSFSQFFKYIFTRKLFDVGNFHSYLMFPPFLETAPITLSFFHPFLSWPYLRRMMTRDEGCFILASVERLVEPQKPVLPYQL